MGNMSNPSINRWGLNLFWYKHWYNDVNYHLPIQHDFAINKLVYTFLNFGILFPVNIFIHKYWSNEIKNISYHNDHNTKYYRVMNFKNFITQEVSHYNERIKIENVYQSKIWILKFQHWVVINFYCFNPIKKRQQEAMRNYKNFDRDTYVTKKLQNYAHYKRLKLSLLFFLKKITKTSTYYHF